MANGLNKVHLIGNLGQDPELKYTQNGNAVCNLRLAIGERRKKGDEWEEHTEWVSVVCFGRTAENTAKFMAKGKPMFVEGRMQTRSYEKDGVTKRSTEVVANSVIFLGSGDKKGSSPRKELSVADRTPEDDGFYDDDLPF